MPLGILYILVLLEYFSKGKIMLESVAEGLILGLIFTIVAHFVPHFIWFLCQH